MLRVRVIPCLLLKHGALVKTIGFKNASYVGSPINTVKIFNDQCVDELIFLDIAASKDNAQPDFDLIQSIANECFMPFTYGGGIRSIAHAEKLFTLGVEKIALNSYALSHPELITELATRYGSQSITISVDVKKTLFGQYKIFNASSQSYSKTPLLDWVKQVEDLGAGELLLTSVERDGTMKGFDLSLIQKVASHISIPLIASGGAGVMEDLTAAIKEGKADAIAVGSMVVYQGQNRAVLTHFPTQDELAQYIY